MCVSVRINQHSLKVVQHWRSFCFVIVVVVLLGPQQCAFFVLLNYAEKNFSQMITVVQP